MRDRVVEETYMKVTEVAKHFGVSRSTIEELPFELLPYADLTPTSVYTTRRYSPADVLAYDARVRGYLDAKAQARSEEYLRTLRTQLEEDAKAVIAFAREVRREVA